MSDIKRIKQLAGLAPLVEAWDADDYDRYMNVGSDNMKDSPSAGGGMDDEMGAMSPAERRLAMAAQRELSQKGISVDDSTDGEVPTDIPTAPVKMTAAAPAPRKGPPRRLTKATLDPEIARQLAGEDDPAGDDNFAASPAAVAGGDVPAAAGDAPVMARGDKSAKAIQYFQLNPSASRSEFMQFAARELGMGSHYANTLFYNPKMKAIRMAAKAGDTNGVAAAAATEMPMEFYVVQNTANGRVLAEKTSYDVPTWTTFDKVGMFEPMIFESEIHAKKAIAALAKYGFSKVKLVKETF